MGRKYSIAIQAHGEHASDAPPRISTVVEVDEDGRTQLIEMTVGAADGGPIPAGAARNIDLAMLAEALGSVLYATFPPANDATPVKPTAAARESSATSTRAYAPEPKERPYRRMPKAAEVAAIIQQTGSVGKLAQHFSVPRYTAQAWVNRLRRTGQLGDVHSRPARA